MAGEKGPPHPLRCSAPHRISPQNSRGTSVALRCCILCHHPANSNLGVPQIGTLGRNILPPLLPQQKWLPAGMKDGDTSSQRRLGWAGLGRRPRKGTGHSNRQLLWQAGSTLVGAEARGAVTRRERGEHCSLRPTHHTVQRDAAGLGNLSSPPLAPVLSGGKMHTVPHGEGAVRAGTPAQAATLDAG